MDKIQGIPIKKDAFQRFKRIPYLQQKYNYPDESKYNYLNSENFDR